MAVPGPAGRPGRLEALQADAEDDDDLKGFVEVSDEAIDDAEWTEVPSAPPAQAAEDRAGDTAIEPVREVVPVTGADAVAVEVFAVEVVEPVAAGSEPEAAEG